MNEIIIANNSLPQLCGCGLFAASDSFIHTDRVPDFCVLIYVIDGCILSLIHISEPTRQAENLVCRLLLEKKKKKPIRTIS